MKHPIPARHSPFYAALAAGLLTSTITIAAEQTFDIRSQALSSALTHFSALTGLQVLYEGDIAEHITAPELVGSYTPEVALQNLLRGSGLQYRFSNGNTVTLEKVAAMEPQSAVGTTTLPSVTVTGRTSYDPTNPFDTNYGVPNSSTATKTDTPLMETPMAVKVITQQVLRDQQAVRIDKALENVSGVYQQPSSLGDISFFSIRGFGGYDGNSSFLYRNGVRGSYSGADASFPDMANIDRIEVLKGPASILYGRVEPGGMVNLVTKQPLHTPYYSLMQQFGSFDHFRTSADATGPISQDGSLAYRLNLAYENKGSFQDFANSDRVFVAPVLRWQISDQTTANFWMDYIKANDSILDPIPSLGPRPAPIPRSRSFGEPENGQMKTEEQRFGFNLTHAFNDNWQIRQVFDARHNENTLEAYVGNQGIADETACTPQDCQVLRYGQAFRGKPRHSAAYFNSLDLTGHFDTVGLDHTLLVGADFWHSTFEATGNEIINLFGGEIANVDLNHPNYTGIPFSVYQVAEGYNQPNSWQDWFGFYAQDQIKLPYGFHILGGLRYDDATSHTESPDAPTQSENRVSPRAALLWQPIPQLSLYGNYVENFGAAGGQQATGGFLPPQTAQQWELGAKTELLDGRLTGSIAWFDITKQNVAVPDPTNLALARAGFLVPVGEVHNQGLEIDLSGEVVKGWKTIASYAYIDSIISKDARLGGPLDDDGNPTELTAGNTGNQYFGVPRHGGSLWNTYDFQQSSLSGLKVGAGILLRSQQQANNDNTVQLPGYATVNLMASYQLKFGATKVTTQLNVDNLLDKTYYSAQGFGGGTAGFAGMPRSFLGSVRIEY